MEKSLGSSAENQNMEAGMNGEEKTIRMLVCATIRVEDGNATVIEEEYADLPARKVAEFFANAWYAQGGRREGRV